MVFGLISAGYFFLDLIWQELCHGAHHLVHFWESADNGLDHYRVRDGSHSGPQQLSSDYTLVGNVTDDWIYYQRRYKVNNFIVSIDCTHFSASATVILVILATRKSNVYTDSSRAYSTTSNSCSIRILPWNSKPTLSTLSTCVVTGAFLDPSRR